MPAGRLSVNLSGLGLITLVDHLETGFSASTEKCQGFSLPAAGGRAGTENPPTSADNILQD